MTKPLLGMKDLVVDDDARTTWERLSDGEKSALLRWTNAPWTARSRRSRQRDATRALQLGGAKSGLETPSVLETILTSLPWGKP
jgi:hypothetical protein